MIKIIRGIVILLGIAMVFLVITACSSDSVFAKKDKVNQKNNNYSNASEKEDFSYNDETDNETDNPGIKSQKGDKKRNQDSVYKEGNDIENESYYQKGNASWYGREFHGRKTASGEKYDMNKLTAAHKKLPLGTKLLVRNMENGKSVSVTINDRGPYVNGRILDLSYGAAKKLDMVGNGEAKVGLIIRKGNELSYANKENRENDVEAVAGESIEEGDSINAKDNSDNEQIEDTLNKGHYSIQAGAFYSRRNAEKFQKRVEKLVDYPVVIMKENDMYKIKIDKLSTKKNAGKVKKMLKSEDITSYIVESKN